MGNTISITKKVSFEDIQFLIKQKSRNHLLINTLPINEQNCLIRGTVNVSNEEKIVNENIYNSDMYIVIYGKNSNEDNIVQKYSQLENLGFKNVYIYPGGLFEWLCLQDIYGDDEFPTTSNQLDILKYKPHNSISVLRLCN